MYKKLIFLLILTLLPIQSVHALISLDVWTDKSLYHPGEPITVYIEGTGLPSSLEFPTSCQVDYIMDGTYDSLGECAQVLTGVTLPHIWTIAHDMSDYTPGPGLHSIRAYMHEPYRSLCCSTTHYFTVVPQGAHVNITAYQVGDSNEFIIGFDATSEPNLVRAFAFDIQLDNDANIVAVTGLSPDYYIFPGTIQIDSFGNVIDYGTAVAEYGDLPGGTLSGLDSNGVTIEMASLYAPVGPGSPNAPAKSGDLLSIIVSDDTCLTISANVARAGATGVVMEDPDEVVNVIFPGHVCTEVCCGSDCMKTSAPEYPEWVAWGKPKCWCYARQCRGDSDGLKIGPFWVQMVDLNALVAAFNKIDTMLPADGICSDYDHMKVGPFRVQMLDLNTFVTYFNKIETLVPECDNTNYNFWETP